MPVSIKSNASRDFKSWNGLTPRLMWLAAGKSLNGLSWKNIPPTHHLGLYYTALVTACNRCDCKMSIFFSHASGVIKTEKALASKLNDAHIFWIIIPKICMQQYSDRICHSGLFDFKKEIRLTCRMFTLVQRYSCLK